MRLIEQFKEYILVLYLVLPPLLRDGLIFFFILALVLCFVLKGLKNGWKLLSKIVLVEYIFLIYCSTVFFRKNNDLGGYSFIPFWSYEEIAYGRHELLVENTMNVLAFLPIGLLLGLSFKCIRSMSVLLICLCLSLSIEIMQFMFGRGFSEMDDLIHNTCGGLIGFWSYCAFKWIKSK